jgi:lycopene cyclase domain-containing protein
MTYAAFLLQFLVIPILILSIVTYLDRRGKRSLPSALTLLPGGTALAILAAVAVIYTTPWDNYLVATRVWWYDPALVTGITLGWVPIEEYGFFVLQTLMTGLWLLLLARRIPVNTPFSARPSIRSRSAIAAGIVWVAALLLLISGWQPGKYLGLELAWALPPIVLQLAVGADILWHYRRLVVLVLFSSTLYLCGMDALAIQSGTWTINPGHTLGYMIGGILPLEEAVFFLLTNTLLVFGLVLALATESLQRLPLQLTKVLLDNSRHVVQ